MKVHSLRRIPVLLISLCMASFLFARETHLSLELSEDLSFHDFNLMKFSDNGTLSAPREWEVAQDEAVEVLLEEARWIFSGMIYGFTYYYVPGSKALEVEDTFKLEPLFEIPRGDPAFHVEKVSGDYSRITVQFVYWLDESQRRRYEQFRGSSFSSGGGLGSEPFINSGAYRISMEKAVKEALRGDLRQKYYDRPREAEGILTFSHPPEIRIASGCYNSSVRILYKVKELSFYPSR